MKNPGLRWLATACLIGGTILSTPASAGRLTIDVVDASDGTPLKDAVVELYSPTGSATSVPQREIIQRDQAFAPYVLGIPVGSSVAFPNHDDTRHHVYSFSPAKTFELKLYLNEPMAPVIFDKPGIVVLGCNIHDHMQAFVVVSDAPRLAMTDSDGRVSFEDLPAQPMRLTTWHPRLSRDHMQRQEQHVIPQEQVLRVPLTLSVPSQSERPRSSLQQLFDRATQ